MVKRICTGFALLLLPALAAQDQPDACRTPLAAASLTVALPGRPFAAVPTADGCFVFVSLMGDEKGKNPGIAVLKRSGGRIELLRVAPLQSRPAGLALTHDGKLLVAAALDSVVFLDVQRLATGTGNPVSGTIASGRTKSSIFAAVSPDGKLLFVSEEGARSITVMDLERAREKGYNRDAVTGSIPTGYAPIALVFSADGKWLYSTSQVAVPEWGWPAACKLEGSDPATATVSRPEGAVVVVDVERARSNPAQAVAARIPAGCSPVRLALAPGGGTLYVTARNSNAVLAFDTAKLLSDAAHARVGMVTVGASPVPVAAIERGKKIVVGNSNRFGGGNAAQSLSVLDAAKIRGSGGALLGMLTAGAFPRDLAVSADGGTLYLANFGSSSLQAFDVARLPLVTP